MFNKNTGVNIEVKNVKTDDFVYKCLFVLIYTQNLGSFADKNFYFDTFCIVGVILIIIN